MNIKEPRGTVAAWVRDNRVTVPVLLDDDGAVSAAYRITATPTTFVVGRDGKLIAVATGMKEWTGPGGRAFLDALVGK